ncbi:MAG: tetratricopeptide repeat protein [Sulfuriflexus sp.]|nr:tetratricopeptide repeat protein [Sulfuriflexus sp.]
MKKFALLLGLICLPLIAHADIGRAQQLFDEQRFGETLEKIDAILAKQATHQQALFLKAMTLERIGRVDDAIKTYKLLNRKYPKSPEAYNNLAALYAKQGNYELAQDSLLAALKTHASYATAYENLNDIYSRMANNAYSKALALENKNKPTVLALKTINKLDLPAEKITANLPLAKNPVAVVKIKPAAAVTKPVTITKKPNETELIIDTILGWSNAWSAQNSDAYLAYYATRFSPPNGYSRQRWEQDRRIRLRKPAFIRISIQSPKVTLLSERTARLTFKQDYQSNSFHDAVIKTLLLEKIDGSWQILDEYTAS